MKKLFLLSLSILLYLLSYSQDNKYLPTAFGNIVYHENYVLSYVEECETAEWVTYELTFEETIKNVNRRSGKFLDDESIETGSASHNDYTRSGYDRGHLAPAADMAFSYTAMLESFYMSNVSPQTPRLNRQTWRYLEQDVREYVRRTQQTLYIITGNIYISDITYIGSRNKVAVPTYLYKIIYDGEACMIAFLIPNIDKPELNYFSYITTVDEIEFLTGIDFFSQIEDELEEELESQKSEINWLKF